MSDEHEGPRRPFGPPSQASPPTTLTSGTDSPAPHSGPTEFRREHSTSAHERLSFSQAQRYEEIPGPLKLEELPNEARTRIWNLFFVHLKKSMVTSSLGGGPWLGRAWDDMLEAAHADFHISPLDEWRSDFWPNCKKLREYIETQPFKKVFDLIQFVLRHPQRPPGFIRDMKHKFAECRLAYTIDAGPPPTILPAVTPEEGDVVVGALQTLRDGGLDASAGHLRQASERINEGDWAGSVRESIHAVESVARQLDPKASRTLGPALKSIERRGALHPALKTAFSRLYGYTSDEQGIRHASLGHADTPVGKDEAVFMLGACASFASYLWRRHVAGAPS